MNTRRIDQGFFKKIGLRAVDLINLIYLLICISLLLIFFNRINGVFTYLLIYSALFFLIPIFLNLTKASKDFFIRLLRDWYPPILFIYYYEKTYLFARGIFGGRKFDDEIARLEEFIFGSQPSLVFSVKFSQVWLSEFLHFCYTFYYLLIPLLGFSLWAKRDKTEFHKFMFACVLLMLLCYLIFSLFPVAGPIWFFEGTRAKFNGFIFVKIIDLIVRKAEIPNAAFPSSHVALAFLVLLYSFKYSRRLFWLFTPIILGLLFATVYIKAHYLIDVPAGLILGGIFFLISDKLKTFLEEKFNLIQS